MRLQILEKNYSLMYSLLVPRRPKLTWPELRAFLAARGVARGSDAARALGASQPTLSRLISRHRSDLVTLGAGRATRYAARRQLARLASSQSLYEILESGGSRRLGTLHAIETRAYVFESAAPGVAMALHNDLPYFLYDARPAGFLGRLVPGRHPDLDLPADLRDWSDEHCLTYFVRHGADLPGAWIVGEAAFQAWLEQASSPTALVRSAAAEYPRLAEHVLERGAPGSSAAGEHPKFLARRARDGASLIVKFSGQGKDPVARRVADLLISEHLVHRALARHGVTSSRSAIVQAGGRTFLEVERFDRVGALGRRNVISLAALDHEHVGLGASWTDIAVALARAGTLAPALIERVRWLERFGGLIANTDMHAGNLSFLATGLQVQGLAPVYDMLPMLYAPQHNQLVERVFSPTMPAPADAAVWASATSVAREVWSAIGEDERVSREFRAQAKRNAKAVAQVAELGALLPR